MTELSGNSKPVDTVYLDLREVFDIVPHMRLISTLRGCCLKGKLLDWIQDFLNTTTQFVKINDEVSALVTVTSGVPQGSVLGPTLLMYYRNGRSGVVNCGVNSVGDDTKASILNSGIG